MTGPMSEVKRGPLTVVQEAFADRISGKVSGNYVVFWLIWNWKVPVILIFSDSGADGRISAILELYKDSEWWDAASKFMVPLLLTAAYLILIPLARNAAVWWESYWEARNKHIAEMNDVALRWANQYGDACDGVLRAVVKALNDLLALTENEVSVLRELENTLPSKNIKVHEVRRMLEESASSARNKLVQSTKGTKFDTHDTVNAEGVGSLMRAVEGGRRQLSLRRLFQWLPGLD